MLELLKIVDIEYEKRCQHNLLKADYIDHKHITIFFFNENKHITMTT